MALFKDWCAGTQQKNKRKMLRTYSEKTGGRAKVLTQLGETSGPTMTSPIGSPTMSPGWDMRALLPQSKRARSGDLGEVLGGLLGAVACVAART